MNAADELIRLYAKQLKVPSFDEYQEVLRRQPLLMDLPIFCWNS